MNIHQENYLRISNNIWFNSKLITYSQSDIENLINFFIEKEEYEKCHILQTKMKERFNHELNYKKKERLSSLLN